MRITQAMVWDVQRMLNEDRMSQRAVARAVGISRSTVGKIASGQRPAWPDRQPDGDCYSIRPTGPIGRCPGCGGRVYMPCRLCHVRVLKSIDRQRQVTIRSSRSAIVLKAS
ncbi:MAG TPA: helix-turn-helix transcriptional regulator [Pirellulales bacterium]|nr:helix-turn-helix transcriptional regulator [Pirellulales bacterium]